MKHYDFFGRELMVGDRVAYIDSKYQELRNGEILKLNEKQATPMGADLSKTYFVIWTTTAYSETRWDMAGRAEAMAA